MYCSTDKWNSLTKLEKGKLLALDVIEIVQNGSLYPTSGYYFQLRNQRVDSNDEIKDILSTINKRDCKMCGIGLSLATLFLARDNFKVKQATAYEPDLFISIGSNSIRDLLYEVWDGETIDHVERAFEGWVYYLEDERIDYTLDKFTNPSKRLIAIMKIIAQDGYLGPKNNQSLLDNSITTEKE